MSPLNSFPENLVFPMNKVVIKGKEKITTGFPKFDKGGLEALEMILQKNKGYKVIFFDNIGKAFAERGNRKSFEEDYSILSPLQEIANKYDVAIIGIHHNRKQYAANPIDEMMGSSSLAAVADTIFVMQKINPTDRSLILLEGILKKKMLGLE